MRWMTRVLSVGISLVYLMVIILAISNEDKPQGAAILVLALLALTIVACFVAWRWEKAGGIFVIIAALCLSITAFSSSQTYGLGSAGMLPSLIYGIPFLVVGTLFWLCSQSATLAKSG